MIKLPTWLAVLLTLLAGVLTVLNQTTFGFGAPWSSYVTIALVFLASLGVLPVVGQAFQALLAKSFPGQWLTSVHALIAAAVAALTTALTSNHWSTGVHAVVAGILTLLVGLGFGPATSFAAISRSKP